MRMKGRPNQSLTHRALSRQVAAKRVMRVQSKEPNTIAYVADESAHKVAVDGNGIKQTNELLADPAVWRVEPCCGDISTAIDIAGSIGSNPDTLTTAVRISYVEAEGIQSLPVVNGTDDHRDTREAAVELFLSAFTENESEASLTRSELFELCRGWHLNLTGQSISRSWFGRALSGLDAEQRDGTLPNRTWTAETRAVLQH